MMRITEKDRLEAEKTKLENEIAWLEGVERRGKRAPKNERKKLKQADIPAMKEKVEELKEQIAEAAEEERQAAIEAKKKEIEDIKKKREETETARQRARDEYSELTAQGETEFARLKREHEERQNRLSMLRSAMAHPGGISERQAKEKIQRLEDEIRQLEQSTEQLQRVN